MKNMKVLVYVKFAIDSMVKYLISDLGITNSSPYNRSHERLIPEPVLQPSLNLKSKHQIYALISSHKISVPL